MEDIPDGVVALLTRSSTDVLSHVAIRARTQGVLLAGCSDDEEWQHLLELQVGVGVLCCVVCVWCYAFAPPPCKCAGACAVGALFEAVGRCVSVCAVGGLFGALQTCSVK
jgi:hypothetical protein